MYFKVRIGRGGESIAIKINGEDKGEIEGDEEDNGEVRDEKNQR